MKIDLVLEVIHKAIMRHAGLSVFDYDEVMFEAKAIKKALKKKGLLK